MANEKRYVAINAKPRGYSPAQAGKTMTVGELIEHLRKNFNTADEVYLRFDGGFSYSSLYESDFSEKHYDTEDI